MIIHAYKETNYYPAWPVWFFKVSDGGSTTIFEFGPNYEQSLFAFNQIMRNKGYDPDTLVIEKGSYVSTWVPDATR